MSTSTTALQAPPTGRYLIDGTSSQITFTTKHMFGLGTVRGRFGELQGDVVVTDRVERSTASAVVPASSFTTRNPVRDVQVRSLMFLNARRHPTIAFHADGLSHDGDAWTLHGTLTVKGKSAPLELTVTDADVDGTSASFAAHGTVDRYALGVTAFRGMAARHLAVDVRVHTHLA